MQNANKTRGVGPLGGSGIVGRWGGSSLVRSVQRGVITYNSATQATATITAVDVNNSIVIWLGQDNGGVCQDDTGRMRIDLNSATTVRATRQSNNAYGSSVSFEVIEFEPGLIKQRQAISGTFSSSPLNTTITAVNMNKTIVFFNGCDDPAASSCSYTFMRISLASTTTVNFTSGATNSQVTFATVVEFY